MGPSSIQEVGFFERHSTRLISAAYITEPALTPLADNDQELAFFEELEGLSSSRRGSPDFIPANVSPNELLTEHFGYGWTYVNAAFCYTHERGNRFNGPDRGAWYAAWGDDRVATAQAEVAWHLTQELSLTGVFENVTEYRELHASFATSFHDLTQGETPDIHHKDIAIGHRAGQALATKLLANGSNGVLYNSVRNEGGKCLAAFKPAIVQNVQQGDGWLFTWSGSPSPEIVAL